MESYLNTSSPTGYEAPGQKVWLEYLKPYIDEWHLDDYGTAYGVINPEKEYKVVIEAHADEIAWRVHYITKEGFINVIRNGGSDHLIAPSKRVHIHTKKGIVNGVFGWPAIHTRKGKDSKITPDVCRAIDNRMGGFCIAEVARMLKEKKKSLPFALYIVNAVQEEVGLRGASMVANRIKPNVALVTDVTHDTSTPLVSEIRHGAIECGKGPSLTYAPAVHNKLLDLIETTADKKKIPFQREGASRATGTDTDAFAYSNNGVPSALISLPLRYMHTTVEMCHKTDVENVVKLIYETLLNIKENHNFKYF